jgi:hypothetical protein
MPSCSSSSNISSSISSLSVTQGGSRLIVAIPYVAGLTVGNVIRYDVPTSGYTASKANLPANSEVFGIIEGYDSTTSKFNVVMYGSISLSSTYLADVGSAGGSGGNDIYFLSGSTAGLLQNLAPTDLDYIVKPVYQAAPHGSYTGVVINYLGYRIGGEVQSSLLDSELGNIQIVVGNNTFTDGYVDASTVHDLPIADYSEFYSKFGTVFGYVEAITVSDTIAGTVVAGLSVSQVSSSYSGTIKSVDYANKIIYVNKTANSSLASTSTPLTVTINATTQVTYTVSSRSVYAAYSPIIRLTNPLDIEGLNGDVTQTTKIGFKVKPQGIRVSVPTNTTLESLTADEIVLGGTDLQTTLNSIDSRLNVIEARLGI